jgi:hypothetical protein
MARKCYIDKLKINSIEKTQKLLVFHLVKFLLYILRILNVIFFYGLLIYFGIDKK